MSSSRTHPRLRLERTHRPARNVLSRSGGMPRGKFPSRKNGRMVAHEHLLEREALVLLEFSPAIAAVREQPRHIYFADGAETGRYTPDFEVLLANGSGRSVLIEVKPTAQLQKDEVRARLTGIHAHLLREGEEFVILTDTAIRQQPRLSNLKSLRKYLPPFPPDHHALRLAIRRMTVADSCTLGDVVSVLGWSMAVSLLTAGYAQIDLTKVCTSATQIQFSKEIRHDWFFLDQEHGF